MADHQIEKNEFQHILEEVNAYSVERYEALMNALKRLHPLRNKFSSDDWEIIKKIKEGGLPLEEKLRMKALFSLQSENELSENDYQELTHLITLQEPWQLERAKLLAQLSKKWNVDIREVHRRIGTDISELVYG